MARRHLLGLWRAEFEGGTGATLLLETHPEFAQSVRGAINRDGDRALLAGDVEDGEFTKVMLIEECKVADSIEGD